MAVSMILRNEHILTRICRYLRMEEACVLMTLSPTLYDAVGHVFKTAFIQAVQKRHVDNGQNLIDILRRCGAFVSGDVALELALFNVNHRPQIENILTINCSVYSDAVLKEYLRREGYRRVADNSIDFIEDRMDLSSKH